MTDIHPDNRGADWARVYKEFQDFLGIVADWPDEYAAMMRDLPERQRRQVEELFPDYLVAFAQRKGCRCTCSASCMTPTRPHS